MGIEPTCAAWKAAVLPLNYARKSWAHLTQGNKNEPAFCESFVNRGIVGRLRSGADKIQKPIKDCNIFSLPVKQ